MTETWVKKPGPWRSLAAACFVALLGGCVDQTSPSLGLAGGDAMPNPDLSARGPTVRGAYGPVTGGRPAGAQVFTGTAPSPAPRGGAEPVRYADASDAIVPAGGDGYQLNFQDADVGEVSKAILSDILKANYLVDKRVSGQVTLTSAQPVPRARLVSLLESSLASLGATVVKDQDMYRVVPTGEAGGMGTINTRDVGEGFGTSVIVAKYMPAANLGRLLEGFGSRSGSVRTDPGTNLVIIQGTSSERRAALDAAEMVDVNWMRSRSVAILPVANSAPDTIIGELNRILDSGEGGMAQGAIQLQPMSRMNAVLAVAQRPEGLDLVRRWVTRLDRSDPRAAGVKVYRLQYAQAKTVAAALNDLFGSGGGSGGASDKDALEPSGAAPTQTGTSPGGSPGTSSGGLSSASVSGAGGSGEGGSSSPFGALKAAMVADAKPKPAGEDFGSSRGGGGNGAVRVTADTGSNSLLINASAADYKAVEQAIRQLDRQPVQVEIEATIAEVTLTDQLQYGVQFFLQGQRTLGLSGATNLTLPTFNAAGANLLLGGLSSPRVLLDALQSYTKVKVLSSPSLVVLDRQTAVLQVGDQVPILTQSAQSVQTTGAPVVNSVDYKDTGVILNVLPKVNANGIVTLDVEQQVSAVVNASDPTLTPTISQRHVHSSIAVTNGQTVMLGGLISDTRSTDRSGLPGVSSIQFLNDLLSSHDSAVNRTEIIIFIRPRIITSAADAQAVTEEFHDRLLSMRGAPGGPARGARGGLQ